MSSASPYLVFRPSNPDVVRLRLICFPYAGAGASVFGRWPASFPPDVEIIAVQLPGRESRISEPVAGNLRDYVSPLVDAIAPLSDKPMAFFGHSMGALLAFDTAQALRAR